MTGFTKGPWSYGGSVEEVWGGVIESCGYHVASAHGKNDDECKANAHLIAAAPDLYEALEWLETYAMIQVDRHPDAEDNKGWRRIIAALAKARGEKT